jgi:8-oxo-dGTP pyrophosphatase MutT (NUDIX family)
MYRIYINQTALIITESTDLPEGNYQQIDAEGFDFIQFYQRLKHEKAAGVFVLLTSNAKRLFNQIKLSLKVVRAAGGVVRSEENKFLFIFRKGVWDLPKGKIEVGEKKKKAALREVEEECGIVISSAGEKICKTYHVYEMFGEVILKKTTWYSMQAANAQTLIPQLEEDITEARWIAPGDFSSVRENTHPLILDVMSMIEI